jgi:3'(2'), 5'-bisphosphate nucleotidase
VEQQQINDLCKTAIEAGEKIMQVFNTPETAFETKADNSPLTVADKLSHEHITAALQAMFPDIPVISEEDKSLVEFDIRKDYQRFWLIDPLDGTKEFIRKERDFTVNIALIENHVPVLGIVYAPAREWLYVGDKNGARKICGDCSKKLPSSTCPEVTAVRSKSHSSDAEEVILEKYNATKSTSMGSSLKFCLVAEGEADIYYRAGPTWEWDSAAAHAIVLAAGGVVYEGNSEESELKYNKKTLLNDKGFLCLGKKFNVA